MQSQEAIRASHRGGRVGICTVLVFCGVFSTRFGFRAGFVGAGILLIYFSSRRLKKRLQTTGGIYKKVADGRRVGLGRPCGLPQAHPPLLLHAGNVLRISSSMEGAYWRPTRASSSDKCYARVAHSL